MQVFGVVRRPLTQGAGDVIGATGPGLTGPRGRRFQVTPDSQRPVTSHRLLLVSNRLPVSARMTADGVRMVPSSGGLATGLGSCHARSESLWFGWPGDISGATTAQREQFDQRLHERRIVPVHLTGEQVDRNYHGFANRVLWPSFHYLVDRVSVDASGWDDYRDVNETFAEVVAREYRTNDTIWVHDYHLMLLPALLRERLPRARIGFFLHIPFPSSEVFRILPWRHEILNGLLGADLVGFHTFAYMRHFVTSLLHVDGMEADLDRVRAGDREVKLGVFPMGVDAAAFADLAADADVLARVDAIRRDAGGRRIVLGVDRLDYTKGIPRRLEALERLLEREPDLRDGIRYIQVAVPSRGKVDGYRRFRRQVEERVGHINGAYGTLRSLPVHYVHQSLSPRDLVALYCAADLMLVTPLRDGMNLVAKEFVASRVDEDAVLVLSEFAGAAAELNGAITVNPYDIEGVADSIHRALSMSVEERRARMRTLRRRVLEHDVHAWAGAFIQHLHLRRPLDDHDVIARPGPSLPGALAAAQRTMTLRLLLDYDGTLVPLARSPELAAPDDDLLFLLERLIASPGIQVDIVSGRSHETLEQWFGHLPVSLWAEHGFWHRSRHGEAWQAAITAPPDWMERVHPLLEQFAVNTPGSHVEVKSASIAWHYRCAPREFGTRQAHELRMLLGDILSNQPLQVLEGKKVIEVRLRGIGKGLVAQRVQTEAGAGSVIVAIGDDRTDEELFRALPPSSLAVAVGRTSTSAKFRLEDYRAVRRILRSLVAEDRSGESRLRDGLVHERVSA
jgi:trehalose 6-phosphate synthase/phosphatase